MAWEEKCVRNGPSYCRIPRTAVVVVIRMSFVPPLAGKWSWSLIPYSSQQLLTT